MSKSVRTVSIVVDLHCMGDDLRDDAIYQMIKDISMNIHYDDGQNAIMTYEISEVKLKQ